MKALLYSAYSAVMFSLLISSFCQAEQQALFDLSLEELLNLPISGSTLSNESVNTVPSSATVFDHIQIRRMGVTTLAELANFAPGFQVLRSSDNSGFVMGSSRGRRISSVSSELLLLIDGKRMRDGRLSALVTLLEFPLDVVERVEFIRGPGSAIYGSGAMMGVINVITRSGDNNGSVSLGSNGSQSFSLSTDASNDRHYLDLLLNLRQSEGQSYQSLDSYTGEPTETQDPYSHKDVLLKAGSDKLKFSGQFSEQRYWDFYTLDVVDSKHSEHLQQFSKLSLSYIEQYNDWFFDSTISLDRTHNETLARLSEYGAYSEVSQPESAAPYLTRWDFASQELQLNHNSQRQLNSEQTITLGISANRQELLRDALYSNFNFAAGQPYTSSNQLDFKQNIYQVEQSDSYAAFGQWQIQAYQKGEFTLGLRYDRYQNLSLDHFSPRFAWVYKVSDEHNLKLLYSQAFRAPNLQEFGLKDTTFIRSNPDLKPETVTTTELIWLTNLKSWFWSLSYFHNQFHDPILQALLPGEVSSGIRQYGNSASYSIDGMEAELHWQWGQLLLTANATRLFQSDPLTFRESNSLASFTHCCPTVFNHKAILI